MWRTPSKHEGHVERENYVKSLGTAMWSHPSVLVGDIEIGLELGHTEWQRWPLPLWSSLAQARVPHQGGRLRQGWRLWGVNLEKGKGKEKEKEMRKKKNSEKQWGVTPQRASLTAFLPGPSPKAATMAKY